MAADQPAVRLFSRQYQFEMFEASMKQNVIVAMATGSGKTQVAKLRIEAELQRTPAKRIWFTAPNTILAAQQHCFLTSQLPMYSMRLLTGSDNVDLWRTQQIWNFALEGINVVVSTPQVLLDALRNAFFRLEELSLLAVDECHHCQAGAPSAKIMLEFYHPLKLSQPGSVPKIIGLTASTQISKKTATLAQLEACLDATCCTPTRTLEDYALHVHIPEIRPVTYESTPQSASKLLQILREVVNATDYREDPVYVARSTATDDASLTKVEKFDRKKETPSTKDMKALLRNAENLHTNMGSWASGRFIQSCVRNWHEALPDMHLIHPSIHQQSAEFINQRLAPVREVSSLLEAPRPDSMSGKAQKLVRFLESEYHEGIAIIIFVEQRAAAYALCELLRSIPAMSKYRIFSFVGNASSRNASLAEMADIRVQKKALADFRDGTQDVCIATSVAEEGVDIQAVNIVIRYDDPKQFVSFLQSRGRARHQKSKFVFFQDLNGKATKYDEWQEFEKKLIEEYQDEHRALQQRRDADAVDLSTDDFYEVSSTGARLSHENSVQHLQHFATTVSHGIEPIYVLEIVEGSISARVILPSCVPPELRQATSQRSWPGEKTARRDAAFQACRALHQAGQISDNLVPFQKEKLSGHGERDGLRQYEIDGEIQLWQTPQSNGATYAYRINVSCDHERFCSLVMILPNLIEHTVSFPLSTSGQRTLLVNVVPLGRRMVGDVPCGARASTRTLFKMVFGEGSALSSLDDSARMPLLLYPEVDETDNFQPLRDFLANHQHLLGRQPLLIWDSGRSRPYIWHTPYQQIFEDLSIIKTHQVRKLQIYAGLHGMTTNQTDMPQLRELDINSCQANCHGTIYGPVALLVPSILHMLTAALRAEAAMRDVFAEIGFSSAKHLTQALISKSASGTFNYERMEFLGDAYLKYRSSIQMFCDYPHDMEDALTVKVKSIVSNLNMEAAVRRLGLDPYITTEVSSQKHWKLPRIVIAKDEGPSRKVLSKTLADVVESCLGAAYLDGGNNPDTDAKCTAMLNLFLPETAWVSPIELIRAYVTDFSAQSEQTPPETAIEELLGHRFLNASILQEALTHSSLDRTQLSYQRLEFLGDAVLDMVIKRRLFAHRQLGPDRMTQIRHALASHVLLAHLTMWLAYHTNERQVIVNCDNPTSFEASYRQVFITDLLYFQNMEPRQAIHDARNRHSQLQDEIGSSLEAKVFPWTLLRAVDAPKTCSDVIEALLAAVFLDTKGSFDACEAVLDKLGLLDMLSRMATNDGFEVRTPATQLRELCAQRKMSVAFKVLKDPIAGAYTGKVEITKLDDSGNAECVGRKAHCCEEARSTVAETALEKMLEGTLEFNARAPDESCSSQDAVMTDASSIDSPGEVGGVQIAIDSDAGDDHGEN